MAAAAAAPLGFLGSFSGEDGEHGLTEADLRGPIAAPAVYEPLIAPLQQLPMPSVPARAQNTRIIAGAQGLNVESDDDFFARMLSEVPGPTIAEPIPPAASLPATSDIADRQLRDAVTSAETRAAPAEGSEHGPEAEDSRRKRVRMITPAPPWPVDAPAPMVEDGDRSDVTGLTIPSQDLGAGEPTTEQPTQDAAFDYTQPNANDFRALATALEARLAAQQQRNVDDRATERAALQAEAAATIAALRIEAASVVAGQQQNNATTAAASSAHQDESSRLRQQLRDYEQAASATLAFVRAEHETKTAQLQTNLQQHQAATAQWQASAQQAATGQEAAAASLLVQNAAQQKADSDFLAERTEEAHVRDLQRAAAQWTLLTQKERASQVAERTAILASHEQQQKESSDLCDNMYAETQTLERKYRSEEAAKLAVQQQCQELGVASIQNAQVVQGLRRQLDQQNDHLRRIEKLLELSERGRTFSADATAEPPAASAAAHQAVAPPAPPPWQTGQSAAANAQLPKPLPPPPPGLLPGFTTQGHAAGPKVGTWVPGGQVGIQGPPPAAYAFAGEPQTFGERAPWQPPPSNKVPPFQKAFPPVLGAIAEELNPEPVIHLGVDISKAKGEEPVLADCYSYCDMCIGKLSRCQYVIDSRTGSHIGMGDGLSCRCIEHRQPKQPPCLMKEPPGSIGIRPATPRSSVEADLAELTKMVGDMITALPKMVGQAIDNRMIIPPAEPLPPRRSSICSVNNCQNTVWVWCGWCHTAYCQLHWQNNHSLCAACAVAPRVVPKAINAPSPPAHADAAPQEELQQAMTAPLSFGPSSNSSSAETTPTAWQGPRPSPIVPPVQQVHVPALCPHWGSAHWTAEAKSAAAPPGNLFDEISCRPVSTLTNLGESSFSVFQLAPSSGDGLPSSSIPQATYGLSSGTIGHAQFGRGGSSNIPANNVDADLYKLPLNLEQVKQAYLTPPQAPPGLQKSRWKSLTFPCALMSSR